MAKAELPVKIRAPEAVARQLSDFGDASGHGPDGRGIFFLSAGTDIAPLLKGLEDDLCQSPHWDYMISGEVTVLYKVMRLTPQPA